MRLMLTPPPSRTFWTNFALATAVIGLSATLLSSDLRPTPSLTRSNQTRTVATQPDSISPEQQELIRRAMLKHQNRELISRPIKIANFSQDMIKFYTAVGFITAGNCLLKGDPTICNEWITSLQDPVGHLGFILFVQTSHFVNKHTAARLGPSAASYLGLAAGHFVNTKLMELWASPTVRAYLSTFKSDDPNRFAQRDALLEEMWAHVSSKKSYIDLVPDIASLFGAAYLTSKSMNTVGKGLRLLSRKAKIIFDTESAAYRIILKTKQGFQSFRIMSHQAGRLGVRLIWKGGRVARIAGVIGIGVGGAAVGTEATIATLSVVFLSAVLDTVVFLGWDQVIGDPLKHFWNTWSGRNDLWSTHGSFDSYLKDYLKTQLPRDMCQVPDPSEQGTCSPEQHFKDLALQLRQSWDTYRSNLMTEPTLILNRYATLLNETQTEIGVTQEYYNWILRGMNDSDESFSDPEVTWHAKAGTYGWEGTLGLSARDNLSKEKRKMLYQFFCGKQAKDAVKPMKNYYVQVSRPSMSPFRAYPKHYYCEHPFDLGDLYPLHEKRVQVLRSQLKETEEFAIGEWNTAYDKAIAAQEDFIDLYEPSILHSLKDSLQSKRYDYAYGEPKGIYRIFYHAYSMGTVGMSALFGGPDLGWKEYQSWYRDQSEKGAYPNGVLESFEREIDFWTRLEERYGTYTDEFRRSISLCREKRQMALDFMTYLSQPKSVREKPIRGQFASILAQMDELWSVRGFYDNFKLIGE